MSAGRLPDLTSEEEAITYYTAIYYEKLAEKPEVRHNPEDHIILIKEVDELYKRYLTLKGMDESYLPLFLENIDFITKVFTKKREKEEREEKQREYIKSLMKK